MGFMQRCHGIKTVAIAAWAAGILSWDFVTPTNRSIAVVAADVNVTAGSGETAEAIVTESEPGSPGDAADSAASEDELALAEGKALFRGLCSGCHGGAARGGKGPDLTDDRWLHGSSNADISRTIQNGVPGTTMKKLGESLKEEQIARIIAYVRSLARNPGESDWKPYYVGDPEAGKRIFFDAENQNSCNKCHALGGRGGGIGPPLDRIASRRSPDYIMESIVQPSKDIDPQYEVMLVITDSGKTITGIRVNETNFSIQLREQDGRFHSLQKRKLDEIQTLETSLMPDNLVDTLTVRQLHDLFAFLMTLE